MSISSVHEYSVPLKYTAEFATPSLFSTNSLLAVHSARGGWLLIESTKSFSNLK